MANIIEHMDFRAKVIQVTRTEAVQLIAQLASALANAGAAPELCVYDKGNLDRRYLVQVDSDLPYGGRG